MNKEKNKKKNQYQILVILCAAGFIVYAYSFYLALRLHNDFKILMDGFIMFAWCFCGIVWFLELRKINKQERENNL